MEYIKIDTCINAAEFPLHTEAQRLKELCTWIEGNSFHTTHHTKVPEKNPILPIMKCQSQRVLGNEPFPESSRAEQSPLPVEPDPKAGDQGAKILQFKNADWKLSREEGSRNHALGGKKACSGMQWQLSSRHWKRLPRETAEPPSLQIHRAQFDRAWMTWSKTLFQGLWLT